MTATIVKIFGERNTGTRALAQILRQVPGLRFRIAPRSDLPAYDAAVQAAIETQMRGNWKRTYLHAMRDDIADRFATDDPWKHAAPRLTPAMIAAGVRTIIMVRDPYSWLIALARRPYHLKGPNAASLQDFAARPWMTERREGLPAVLASPVDLWSLKMAAGLSYQAQASAAGLPCAILRFEDFVLDPAGQAARVLAELSIEAGPLSARDDNTKSGEAPLGVLQRYYRERVWAERLTRGTVARVNARLDLAAATALGYAPLDPDAFPQGLPEAVRARVAAEMSSLTAPAGRVHD